MQSGAPARSRRQSLDKVLGQFEQLRPQNAWTCDGGAAVLADMLERRHIEHSLRIGLFAPGTEQEEHHHWVEVGPVGAPTLLLDPNGELRGCARVQPLTAEIRKLYRPRDEISSRSDRELMSFSPLWDPELEEFVDITELDDPCVRDYLVTIGIER